MKFRTEYNPGRDKIGSIETSKPVTLIGSCFSDNIGKKMQQAGWEAYVNPCGVLYNPGSISHVISLAAELSTQLENFVKDEVAASITGRDGKYVSWLFSSAISGSSPDECIHSCLRSLLTLRETVAESGTVIITLGTAWVYYRGTDVVSNCHKYPEKEFERRRLSVTDCFNCLLQIWNHLQDINPSLKVIFTVSPVRHLRDGFEGNARSKATLMLAVDEVMQSCLTHNIDYFPAFEILTDDLRDYRFYADDLLHPSQQGIDYIWDKFCDTYLSEQSKALLKERGAAIRRASHKPLL